MSFDIFEEGTGKELYKRIVSFVQKSGMESMLSSGVLIGLSGGADSVFLLHFLRKYLENKDAKISAVHINHLLRGDEALRDEEFSRSICEKLGVEFSSVRVNVASLAKDLSLGIEECARNVRYEHFQKIITGRNDINNIAVAHNSTDNAETIILNMLRGAGSRGCAGIPPIRDNICRPILCVSKAEILTALNEANIDFVFDSSNASVDYSRNYVRHEIIPRFKKLSGNPEDMLFRLSSNLRGDDDFITSCAKDFISSSEIKASELQKLHPALFLRVINLMVGDSLGLSSACVCDIRGLLKSENFKYSLPRGKTLICEHGICKVIEGDDNIIDYSAYFEGNKAGIDVLGSVAFLSSTPFDNSYLNVYKKSIQANIGSAIIEGELRFRPKKDGDALYYGGMTHKLKKLYNDRKIPPSVRDRIPILCDNKGIVWVPGFGVRDDKADKKQDLYVAICAQESDYGNIFLSGFDFK